MGILGDMKRQRLTGEELAKVRQFPVTGSGRVTATAGPGGTSVDYTEPPGRVTEIRVGKIVDTGPNGDEDDWTDERYWISFQVAESGGDPDLDMDATDPRTEFLTLYDAENEYPDDQIVTASNLAEWIDQDAGGTHTLATDGTVVVLAFLWHDDNGTERWVFQREAVQIGVTFYVGLASTGGSNGTSTSGPTYVYTATDLNGTVLGTGLSPAWGRPFGKVTAAAMKGLGYTPVGGGFILLQANEIADTSACPATP
jgi:hypothetical protein